MAKKKSKAGLLVGGTITGIIIYKLLSKGGENKVCKKKLLTDYEVDGETHKFDPVMYNEVLKEALNQEMSPVMNSGTLSLLLEEPFSDSDLACAVATWPEQYGGTFYQAVESAEFPYMAGQQQQTRLLMHLRSRDLDG